MIVKYSAKKRKSRESRSCARFSIGVKSFPRFQFEHLIIESPRATRSWRWGEEKNLGNANAGRTENETRPSFPGFKHSRIYYRRAYSPVRGPRPPRWPATNSHFLFQDRGKNRIIPSWSVLLGYLLVWMISLNAMLREHVSDRSIGKRNDSMTISALLFSRRFRSFGCVIYVDRTIFSFFFFVFFFF